MTNYRFNYELYTILLSGMCLQTMEIVFNIIKDEMKNWLKILLRLIPGIVTSAMIFIILQQQVIFSIVTGILVMQLYRFTYLKLLKSMPFSFTLGEASIAAQSLITFIYSCWLELPLIEQNRNDHYNINYILRVGILAVIFIILVTHYLKIFRHWIVFYILIIATILTLCLVPIFNKPSVIILFDFVFNDIEKIVIIGLYLFLLILMGLVVVWQTKRHENASTRDRKSFHILMCLMFVPGLMFQCYLLYITTIITLAVFLVLEIARVIKLYPVSEILESTITAFIDEKDAGKVALTPFYLLIGCSLPLWIHPSPCDETNSSMFTFLPMLSGIISIGIGDTFASIVGSKFGKHKWWNRNKSVEGTLAGILSQFIFLYMMNLTGYFLTMNQRKMIICSIAVIMNSLVEAFTDQIDNLVLPLITYTILIYK
jgi:dolichol kinase